MTHLASMTSLSLYWLWHPLSGPGYQFWSGIGSDVSEIAIIGGAIAVFRRWNCAAPGCLRHGRHPTADGQHCLCRKHHPDLPNKRLTLVEIHNRHYAAQHKEET